MTPLRIAFVTLGYAPLRMSGLDTSGERLVRTLLEKGHQVTVLAARREPLAEIQHHPQLEIFRLPLSRANWIGFSYRAAQLLKRLNRERPFDVTHFWDVHFAYAYDGRYLSSLHQSFRQRWSAADRSHTGFISQSYRFLYYALARQLAEGPALRRARGLLAVSETTRTEFIQHYHIHPDRIALVRHGIDAEFFHPTAEAKTLRTQLGLSADEPVLLFAGFVTPRKGLDYLARALPLVRPSPRLVLIGHWSPEYRSRFLALAGPCADRVVEPGFVPDEQMPAYYSLADLYVSPSLLEGFGLPLAEALACETPVVAADAGAAAEVVGPGGLLVPPRDSGALAGAISALLNDPLRRREMGALGRAHIARQFSPDQMASAVLNAYDRFR